MNLINKLIAVMLILIGVAVACAGYAVTIELLPNPTSNQWFDMVWIIIGAIIIAMGSYGWSISNE